MSKKTLGAIEAQPKSIDVLSSGKAYGELPDNAKVTSIGEFVKTRRSNFTVDGNPLLATQHDDCDLFALCPAKSDFVLGSIYFRDKVDICHIGKWERAAGFLMLVNGKPCIALDGDENDWDASGDWGVPAFTVSFRCIAHMFNFRNEFDRDGVIKKLVDGDIQIVDFTKDEHRPVSKAILEKLKDKKFVPSSAKPPEFGFTLLRGIGQKARWHRAAWVCFKDREGNFYIMGQDEGSYFCSQLPKTDRKTLTCAEALRMLVPQEANLSTPRQGEWFAVKVSDKTIPALKDCLAFSETGDGELCLPVESDDSNAHILRGNYRIAKDGSVYATDFSVEHSNADHNDLSPGDGWFKLVRNTARRSVSVEGVD